MKREKWWVVIQIIEAAWFHFMEEVFFFNNISFWLVFVIFCGQKIKTELFGMFNVDIKTALEWWLGKTVSDTMPAALNFNLNLARLRQVEVVYL